MIVNGWYTTATHIHSPNYNQRPAGSLVSLLVIHNISLPPGVFGCGYVEKFFINQLPVSDHPYFVKIAALQVSAHLLVSREGALTQFVSLDDRAWHAGASVFAGQSNCNDFSIGIELEGTDECPYTHQQYHSLIELTKHIMTAYPAITPQRIVGHCDISPGRKTDPGPYFDWHRYKTALLER